MPRPRSEDTDLFNHSRRGWVGVVLGAVAPTLPIVSPAQASAAIRPQARSAPSALADLAELGHGELPVDLLVAGAALALLVGLALALALATLTGGRRGTRAVAVSRTDSPAFPQDMSAPGAAAWPTEDADAYRSSQAGDGPRASVARAAAAAAVPAHVPTAFGPVHAANPTDADHWALIEAEAEIEAVIARRRLDERMPATRPASPGTAEIGVPASIAPPPDPRSPGLGGLPVLSEQRDAERPRLPLELQAPPPGPSRVTGDLGTPDFPLVVELREAGRARPVGPSLPLVAAIGTVAAGFSFAGGAVMGATLGLGIAAAIGLAFAGGAGVAVGASIALLAGRRA